MWKMATKGGDLRKQILGKSSRLTSSLQRLYDPLNKAKGGFRNSKKTAVQVALSYLQFDKGSGTAFPPFHAKYLADKYLPLEGDCVVFDPCVGWGGRMLGTLCVRRTSKVTYYGTDPERRNSPAYEGIQRRIDIYLRDEIKGKREAKISYQPFEEWIRSAKASRLFGKVDLVLTSPPYFEIGRAHV